MDKHYWKRILLEAARIDFHEPLPDLDDRFVNVWTAHYAAIAGLTRPGARILEMGTGYAVLAAGLGRLDGSFVLGLEHPSRSYFFSAEYSQFLRQNNVTLIGADFRHGLPLCAQSVDTAYCCDVLEHLEPRVVLDVLYEVSRVVRPGGELVLSTPNLNRFSNLARLIWGHTVNPPIDCDMHGQTCGHIREFSPREMNMYLHRAGFQTVCCKYEHNPYFTAHAFGQENVWSANQAAWINRLTRIAAWVFPRLGDEMYIVARKKESKKK